MGSERRVPESCPAIAAAIAAAQLDWGVACSINADVWQDRLREALNFAAERETQHGEDYKRLREQLAKVTAERDDAEGRAGQAKQSAQVCVALMSMNRQATGREMSCAQGELVEWVRKLVAERDRLRKAGEDLEEHAFMLRMRWDSFVACFPNAMHDEKQASVALGRSIDAWREAVGGGEVGSDGE